MKKRSKHYIVNTLLVLGIVLYLTSCHRRKEIQIGSVDEEIYFDRFIEKDTLLKSGYSWNEECQCYFKLSIDSLAETHTNYSIVSYLFMNQNYVDSLNIIFTLDDQFKNGSIVNNLRKKFEKELCLTSKPVLAVDKTNYLHYNYKWIND